MSLLTTAGGHVRKVAILIVGSAVLLAGIAMLALPGPGVVVIIVGLLILAQEFAWAERLLDIAVERVAAANSRAQESRHGRLLLVGSGTGLIVAGIAVIAVWPRFVLVGVSLILAGIIGLCTLHPKVHAWVEERALTGIDDTDDVPAR